MIIKVSVVIIDGARWEQNGGDVALAWRECTMMSFRDSVLW